MSREKTPAAGVLIQEMVPAGTELILGCQNDVTYGPTVVFGLGGIFVEVFNDVRLKLAPLTKADALAAISEIKGAKLLKGARGRPPADLNGIADLLVLLGQFVMDHADTVQEIDINPLIAVHGSGQLRIADALIVLKSDERSE
jgi:acetyltransferase